MKSVAPGGPELFNPYLDAQSEERIASDVVVMLELVREVVAHVQAGLDGFCCYAQDYVRPGLCVWDVYSRYWQARTKWLDDPTEFTEAKQEALEVCYALLKSVTARSRNPFLWDGRLDVVRRHLKKIMFFAQMGEDEDAETDEEQGAEVQGITGPVERDGIGSNEVTREVLFLDENLQVESKDPRKAKTQLRYVEKEVRKSIREALQYLCYYTCFRDFTTLWFPEFVRPVWAQVNSDPIAVLRYYDLASLEKARMELWLEVHHGRLPRNTFLQMLFEEYRNLDRVSLITPYDPPAGTEDEGTPLPDLIDHATVLRFTSRTKPWYRVVLQLLVQLVCDKVCRNSVQEYLTIFLYDALFENADTFADPWDLVAKAWPGHYWTSVANPLAEQVWYMENVYLCAEYAEAMVFEGGRGSFRSEHDCLDFSRFLVVDEGITFDVLRRGFPFDEENVFDEQTRHELRGIGGLKPELQTRVRGLLQTALHERLQRLLTNLPFRWLRLQRAVDGCVRNHGVPGISVSLLRPLDAALDASPLDVGMMVRRKAPPRSAAASASIPDQVAFQSFADKAEPFRRHYVTTSNFIPTLPKVSFPERPVVAGKSGFLYHSARKHMRADTLFSLGSFSQLLAAAFFVEKQLSLDRRELPEKVAEQLESLFYEIKEKPLDESEEEEEPPPPPPRSLFELFANTPVNDILRAMRAPYVLPDLAGATGAGDQVRLRDLTGHAVLSAGPLVGRGLKDDKPSVLDIMRGKAPEELGYDKLAVAREPREAYEPTPAGALVLQYLLELFHSPDKTSMYDILRPWLAEPRNNVRELGFRVNKARMSDEVPTGPGVADENDDESDAIEPYAALGHPVDYDPSKPSTAKRLMLQYPELAGGAIATPLAFSRLLANMCNGFGNSIVDEKSAAISHEGARMLWDKLHFQETSEAMRQAGIDGATSGAVLLARGFDRVDNAKFVMQHFSNEGHCGLFLLCIQGPDSGRGCVICCNAGARLSCLVDVAATIVEEEHWVACATSVFSSKFGFAGRKQKEQAAAVEDHSAATSGNTTAAIAVESEGKTKEGSEETKKEKFSTDLDAMGAAVREEVFTFQKKFQQRFFGKLISKEVCPMKAKDFLRDERSKHDRGPRNQLIMMHASSSQQQDERSRTTGGEIFTNPASDLIIADATDVGTLGKVENLFSPFFPSVDYDSWCTRRHNPAKFDYVRFDVEGKDTLWNASTADTASWMFFLSTGFVKSGDLPERVFLCVFDHKKKEYVDLLPRALEPVANAQHWMRINGKILYNIAKQDCHEGSNRTKFELRMFPDGGVARIALFAEKDLVEIVLADKNGTKNSDWRNTAGVADVPAWKAFLQNPKATAYTEAEASPYSSAQDVRLLKDRLKVEQLEQEDEEPAVDITDSANAFRKRRTFVLNQQLLTANTLAQMNKRPPEQVADILVNVASSDLGALVLFPDFARQEIGKPVMQESSTALLSDNVPARYLPLVSYPKCPFTHERGILFPRQRNQAVGQGSVLVVVLARDRNNATDTVQPVTISRVELDFSHSFHDMAEFVEVFATDWTEGEDGKMKEKQMLERGLMLSQAASDAGNEGQGARLLQAGHFERLCEKRYAKSFAGSTMTFEGFSARRATHVAVRLWPCGALNCLRVLSPQKEFTHRVKPKKT
ncbi:unnamed protein product [Amoebophrya sp. A120]|nr:unnamed protein product [Amoebophrya sp. A120]|eukprot:GSA120T00011721001.1